ncbi:methyl-accepting chemotaxis protein [Pseudoroseicyclus aestuarii]|nr:PAS domain-containing methyl-accepting chemotaxis protein [Pseudoroseicyclus aestuarii]
MQSVIERTQAVIQFTPEGEILAANNIFLKAFGYTRPEIVGRHHSIFVDPEHVKTEGYAAFWRRLADGESFTDEYARIAKDGTTVWIHATYAPFMDDSGKVVKVIKVASDITRRKTGILSISRALRHLSEGNLVHRIAPCGLEDVDLLTQAYNTAAEQLSGMVASVSRAVESLLQTAAEMDRTSSDLSGRTRQQADTVQEAAAGLDKLTQTVRSSADGARAVERSADAARGTAEGGKAVVESAIAAMSKIEGSSTRISQIISTINDIAFQTNLLALNAGVEAARAGNAGLGFAVVASEVRLLAQRSSEAASDIKDLISQSSKHVAEGVALVEQAGGELQKIVAGVAGIHDHVTEITRGTENQTAALAEIGGGVAQLRRVTEQNAGAVDQSGASVRVLAQDAATLSEQVSLFRIGSGGVPAARGAGASAARAS